jgi:hypothetical protein
MGSVSLLALGPVGRILTDRQSVTAHLSCVTSSQLLCPAPIPMPSGGGHSTALSVPTLDLIPFRTELPPPPPRNRNLRRRSSPFSLTVLSLRNKEKVGTLCWKLPSAVGWSVSLPNDGANDDLCGDHNQDRHPLLRHLRLQILARDFSVRMTSQSPHAGIPLFISSRILFIPQTSDSSCCRILLSPTRNMHIQRKFGNNPSLFAIITSCTHPSALVIHSFPFTSNCPIILASSVHIPPPTTLLSYCYQLTKSQRSHYSVVYPPFLTSMESIIYPACTTQIFKERRS